MTTPQNIKSIEQTILSIGHKIYAAIQQKNTNVLEPLLADNFVYRGADRTETAKREFLRGISEMPFEISSVTGEHERVSVFGNVAVMTGVQKAEWRQSDSVHGLNSVPFADVFELRDEQWLLVLAYGVELPG